MDPQKFQEKVKNDPFNKLWESNYKTNLKNKEFTKRYRYPVILMSKKIKNKKIKKPAVLVNPGPSLEKNIHILKQSQEKEVFIFTSDVCFYRLIDEGIIPDVVGCIDPSGSIARFFEGYEEYTKKSFLVAPTTISPDILKKWKGPIIFFNQRDPVPWRNNFYKKLTKKTKDYGSFFNLTFVGGTLIQAAVLFGSTELYLVGWDFATDSSKNPYCKGFLNKRIYTDETFPSQKEKEEHLKRITQMEFEKYQEVILKPKVQGYPTLYTSNQLLFYKNIFLTRILPDVNKIATIINCTEGGILNEIPSSNLKDIVDTFHESQSPLPKGGGLLAEKDKSKLFSEVT